jgi:hypothetical protein
MKKQAIVLAVFLLGILLPVGTWYGPSLTFGTGTDVTRCIAVDDLDKDGFTDIVVGNYGVGEQNVILFGNGDGTFGSPVNFGTGDDLTMDIVLCDVNNDTWSDIVVGNHQEQDVVYINDGDGTFDTTMYNFGSGSDYTYALAFGDVNNDTWVDIAVGNLERQNYVYVNDQSGNPFDTIEIAFGEGGPFYDATWDVEFASMNGDSYLDLVVANHDQVNYVYLGDGDGTFDTTSFAFGVQGEFTHAVAIGYFNNDVFADVVECNYMAENRIYTGDGTGDVTVSHVFGWIWDKTHEAAVGDVNGDTFLDVITCNGGDENQYNKVYYGQGDGTLNTGYSLPLSDVSWDIALNYINGDALLDIVVANAGQNYIYLDLDFGFDDLSTLFDTNAFFVAGDTAYCTDVLGSAKIAFGLGQGGASENPEGRTDLLLTTAEHDTGNLIPVGGPAVSLIAEEFDNYFGITYDFQPGVSFTIFAHGHSIYLDLTQYPSEDICIVYLSEHNGRNVMLVWGYGWEGTYAGSAFVGDPANWPALQGAHMLLIRWVDTNTDGLIQMGEITVEDSI